MEFGIGPIGCRRPPGNTTPFSDIYEAAIGMAETAEDAQFDSAWVAEHHFAEDGYLSSPFTVAGAIASRTGAMEVGIGVAIAPFYEPIRLAEDAAAVNLLASSGGGNCTVGLGVGYRDIEFEGLGVPREERVARLLDTVETCRGAWSDGPMSLDGRVFEYPEVNVTPKPGPGMGLIVGAMAESGIRRAARVADGYIVAPGLTPGQVKDKLGIARETLLEEGRDPSEFDVYVFNYAFVHEDGADAAWETIRESYLYTRRTYLEYFINSSDSEVDLTLDEVDDRLDEFEDRWRSQVVLGTPEEVADQLEAYADFWDDELQMILDFHHPGMDHGPARESIELFGESVIPTLEPL